MAANDFERVTPTAEEVEEYRTRRGFAPPVYRVRCTRCGKRLWGSGLGIGAHRRKCRYNGGATVLESAAILRRLTTLAAVEENS